METATIIRKSVHLFLTHYLFFTTVSALLFFPASASILSSMYIHSSRLSSRLAVRMESVFHAGGIPSSRFTNLVVLKASQMIASFIVYLPSTASFLLLAKACVIIFLVSDIGPGGKPPYSILCRFLPLAWKNIFITYIASISIVFALNSVAFCSLFLAFNSLESLGLPSPINALVICFGATCYAIILANTLIACNLAGILAGVENCSGIVAIVRAGILIRDKAATMLSLSLVVNICLAAIEALFCYRVVKSYKLSHAMSVLWEGPLLCFMYSIVLLLDTIMVCTFYTDSKKSLSVSDGNCGKEGGGRKMDHLSLPEQYKNITSSLPL